MNKLIDTISAHGPNWLVHRCIAARLAMLVAACYTMVYTIQYNLVKNVHFWPRFVANPQSAGEARSRLLPMTHKPLIEHRDGGASR